LVQKEHDKDHPHPAQQLTGSKGFACGFHCETGVHKAASSHKREASTNGQPDVDKPHQKRYEWHHKEGRNAHEKNDLSGLEGIIVGDKRQELRDDEGRSVHHHAQR